MTKKQELFISEYLKDMNATQAYKRAGYKATSDTVARANSYKLLTKHYIKTEIDKLMEKRAKENKIDADWVIKNLKENIDRCMQVKSVIDHDGNEIGIYKWEPSSANKALELLGKHVGMFTDKLELNTETVQERPLKGASTEELKRMLALIRKPETENLDS